MMRCHFFGNCNAPEQEDVRYCHSVSHRSCEHYRERVANRLNRMREYQSQQTKCPLTVQKTNTSHKTADRVKPLDHQDLSELEENFQTFMRRNSIYDSVEYWRSGSEK